MRTNLMVIGLTVCSGLAFAVDGTNLPGHDYANFDAPSAFVCRTTCGGESRCQAYTWVKPGIQGPSGHCWLKDTLPDIVKDADGKRGQTTFLVVCPIFPAHKVRTHGLGACSQAFSGQEAMPRIATILSDAQWAHSLVFGHRKQWSIPGDDQTGLGGHCCTDHYIVIRVRCDARHGRRPHKHRELCVTVDETIDG